MTTTTARIFHTLARNIVDEQPSKYGLWFSPRMQAASWKLAPGQRIVAHCHPAADALLTVVAGHGDFLVYDHDTPPDPAVCYVSKPDEVVVPPKPGDLGKPEKIDVAPGAVTVIPAGQFYALVNTGPETLTAVAVTAGESGDSIYTVREPAVQANGH